MGCLILRKNFYKESPAVRAMTEEEVDEYRLQREITVEGRDVPKPIKSFYDVGFRGNCCLIYAVGSLEDYVHRIGRTGRAGAKRTAYTVFTAANARFAKELIGILEEAGERVSPELAAMGRGAPPPPSGYGSFRDCGRGYGSGRAWS